MFIQTEPTRDPQILRFLPGRPVLPFGVAEYPDEEACEDAPLARQLFQIEGVADVTLETDAVTVRKEAALEWFILKPPIFGVIMDHLAGAAGGGDLAHAARNLLDERIRPTMEAEGGHVRFHGLEDGMLRLEITGSGLSGPVFALQVRIENTFKHYLPEIGQIEFVRPQPDNPQPTDGAGLASPAAIAVRRLLDETINPAVAGHGGFISLVDVCEGAAYIRLEGGCQGCGMSEITLRQGVESAILAQVPEITEVHDVTDHGAGDKPFYRSGN